MPLSRFKPYSAPIIATNRELSNPNLANRQPTKARPGLNWFFRFSAHRVSTATRLGFPRFYLFLSRLKCLETLPGFSSSQKSVFSPSRLLASPPGFSSFSSFFPLLKCLETLPGCVPARKSLFSTLRRHRFSRSSRQSPLSAGGLWRKISPFFHFQEGALPC